MVNGTSGIAVGMANNIPPITQEVIDGVLKLIDHIDEDRETEIDEILQVIKAPDFPTYVEILEEQE